MSPENNLNFLANSRSDFLDKPGFIEFSMYRIKKKELAKYKPRGLHSPSKPDVKVFFHPAPQ